MTPGWRGPACAIALFTFASFAAAHPAPAQDPELPASELRRLALENLRAGNDLDAELHLLELVERFDSVAARVELARLRGRNGDPAAGADLLLEAIDRAPSSEEVLATFGELALAARWPERAVLALEPLARMAPAIPRYAYLLGVARLQVGDLPGSVQAFERAAELEPDRALTQIGLGLALNREKRYVEARAALEHALRLDPGSLEAVAALAEAEEGLDRLEDAERHAQEVLEKRPGHAAALLVLGMVRMKQQRFDDARDALAASVGAEPDSAKAHYQLALALARLGDSAGSERHLARYRDINAATEQRKLELSKSRLAPLAPGRATADGGRR